MTENQKTLLIVGSLIITGFFVFGTFSLVSAHGELVGKYYELKQEYHDLKQEEGIWQLKHNDLQRSMSKEASSKALMKHAETVRYDAEKSAYKFVIKDLRDSIEVLNIKLHCNE